MDIKYKASIAPSSRTGIRCSRGSPSGESSGRRSSSSSTATKSSSYGTRRTSSQRTSTSLSSLPYGSAGPCTCAHPSGVPTRWTLSLCVCVAFERFCVMLNSLVWLRDFDFFRASHRSKRPKARKNLPAIWERRSSTLCSKSFVKTTNMFQFRCHLT